VFALAPFLDLLSLQAHHATSCSSSCPDKLIHAASSTTQVQQLVEEVTDAFAVQAVAPYVPQVAGFVEAAVPHVPQVAGFVEEAAVPHVSQVAGLVEEAEEHATLRFVELSEADSPVASASETRCMSLACRWHCRDNALSIEES